MNPSTVPAAVTPLPASGNQAQYVTEAYALGRRAMKMGQVRIPAGSKGIKEPAGLWAIMLDMELPANFFYKLCAPHSGFKSYTVA